MTNLFSSIFSQPRVVIDILSGKDDSVRIFTVQKPTWEIKVDEKCGRNEGSIEINCIPGKVVPFFLQLTPKIAISLCVKKMLVN